MREKVIYGLLLVAAIVAVSDASAQKYPERRVARDANKLYGKGEFEAAATEYRRALEANPELEDARFNLAGSLFKQGKAQEATRIYAGFAADSTAAAPKVADANFNLGNVMLAGKKIEDAIEFYKQALRLNPGDQQAKYNLAYAQKLLEQQQDDQDQDKDQDQDQDQNQDKDQDQNENDQQDQNEDQQDENDDQDDQQDDQDENGDEQDENGDEGEDEQDENGDEGEDEKDDQQDGDGESESDPDGKPVEAGIDRHDAEQMLEAIQDEEDKTREKMNAKEVQTVGRSGKNW